jgi:ATP-binding cassette subfamily B protein
MVGYLEEALTSTEDIRANGAEIHAIRSFQGRSREMRSATVRALLGVGLIAGLTTAMFQPGIAGALGVATILLEHHQLTLGTVFLVFNYALLLTQPLEELGRQLQDLQSAGAGATRVAELLATRSTLPEAPAADRLGEGGPLALVFDRVTFAYGDGEPALRHITFELPAGESLGVIGRTGSGKTTLARLALRLYDPSVGAVVVGGRDVRTIPTAELRARVALVPQEVQLLHATVRNNITLFDHSITDERVRQALEDLNIGRVGNRGEGGLNEVLAAGGVDLSGGEAQLLALARAFLLNPGLVVLDEASSRVDPATEQALEGAMDRLLAGRTAVVIAHRLSTLQRVDRILVLEEGRVVEVGRRAELAADPGSHLARLLRGDLSEALL